MPNVPAPVHGSTPAGHRFLTFCLLASLWVFPARAEDGYRLWLRYDRIDDAGLRAGYIAAVSTIEIATPAGPRITGHRRRPAQSSPTVWVGCWALPFR